MIRLATVAIYLSCGCLLLRLPNRYSMNGVISNSASSELTLDSPIGLQRSLPPGAAVPILPKLSFYPAIAAICVFFAFAVGVLNLKSDPIENDEFRTLNHIEPVWLSETRSIPETIQSVAALSPQHGPLYFIILNVWHKLVGSDLFSLRFLSTLFGILTIATLYRLASITGRREDGATAAIALSFLAFYLFHVHYLRMYTLLTLVCGWVLLSYWTAAQKRSLSKRAWLSLFIRGGVYNLHSLHGRADIGRHRHLSCCICAAK